MATSTCKPTLPPLKTPMTSTFPSQLSATFPSELSATSARSPFPGFVDFIKLEDGIKTPITPPTAYLDFLKSMSIASPVHVERQRSGILTPTPTSTPSDTSSEHSSCSCHTRKSPTAMVLPSPFVYPKSAPSSARLAHIRIPASPACASAKDSPRSAGSTMRSPFSTRSPYEWDMVNKRKSIDVLSPKASRSGVRHVREIVTRTVTYTPRMKAAPKGKRRKIE